MEEKVRFQGEEFKSKLQEDQIVKLKEQILRLQKQKGILENDREKIEEEREIEKESWGRERSIKEGHVKDERRKRSLLEAKLNNKDEFIEKLLDMLKVPLSGINDNSNRYNFQLNYLF